MLLPKTLYPKKVKIPAPRKEPKLPKKITLLELVDIQNAQPRRNRGDGAVSIDPAKLRSAIESKKINITQFSTECGLSSCMVTHYVTGRSRPSIDTIFIICAKLNILPSSILSSREEPQ